ncbi:MAG: DUF362 domain-containing protein [Dehalococcoidia bacterium]|jgi:uncharacterized protein (DUF362 family)
MNRIDRRDFLRISAGAAVLLGASPLLADCKEGSPSATPAPPTQTSQPLTRVALIKGDDLRAMARDAIDAVGGMSSVVHEGETVFIKPNFVTIGWASMGRDPFVLGECTKPEILTSVAEEALKAGASEVIIGDATQMPSWPWDKVMMFDHSTNMAAEAQRLNAAYKGKVTLACLDADSLSWVEVPSQTDLHTIRISGYVAKADRVISVPVMKTHQWAQLTLSMKCFVGTTPLEFYGAKPDGTMPRQVLHGTDKSIEQVFLDIVHSVTPDLAIIDGSVGIEGNGPSAGPQNGTTIDMKQRIGGWLMVASKDPAAADATAARVTGHDVAQIRQLNMALAQGIGEIREEMIELVGEPFDNVRMQWVPAQPAAPGQLSSMHRHARPMRV